MAHDVNGDGEALEDLAVAVAENHLLAIKKRVVVIAVVMDAADERHPVIINRIPLEHLPVQIEGGEQSGERLFDFRVTAGVWIGHNTAGKARAVMRVVDGNMCLYGSRRRGDQLMRTGRHELVGGTSKAYWVVGREGIQGQVTLGLRATLGDLVQDVWRQNAEHTTAIACRDCIDPPWGYRRY